MDEALLPFLSWDRTMIVWVNSACHSQVVAAVALFLSSRWILIGVWLIVALELLRARRGWLIASVLVALGAADLTTSRVLKPGVGRPRPCHAILELELPGGCGGPYGFPSGHAAVGFSFVGVLATEGRRRRWLLGLASAVAASRVVLGVHYPSDVIVGAAWGFLLGRGVDFGARRLSCLTRAGQASTGRGSPGQ